MIMAARESAPEATQLHKARQRQRHFLELAIRQPMIFAFAVGFDQTCFVSEPIQRFAQGCAERLLLIQINHGDLGLRIVCHFL